MRLSSKRLSETMRPDLIDRIRFARRAKTAEAHDAAEFLRRDRSAAQGRPRLESCRRESARRQRSSARPCGAAKSSFMVTTLANGAETTVSPSSARSKNGAYSGTSTLADEFRPTRGNDPLFLVGHHVARVPMGRERRAERFLEFGAERRGGLC